MKWICSEKLRIIINVDKIIKIELIKGIYHDISKFRISIFADGDHIDEVCISTDEDFVKENFSLIITFLSAQSDHLILYIPEEPRSGKESPFD